VKKITVAFFVLDVDFSPLPWLMVKGDFIMSENNPIYSQKSEMAFGNFKFIITTHFDTNATETAEDKMVRLVTNRIAAETKGETP
jgi:hypothetical protein